MHRRLSVAVTVVSLVVFSVACGGQATPVASDGGPITDYVSLIDGLRAAGAKVAGDDMFFSVPGRTIRVDDENVQVFEYEDAASLEDAAGGISADGFTIRGATRTVHVDWMAPPHFYKKGKLLVLYVGDDIGVRQLLEDVLGEQFAGR